MDPVTRAGKPCKYGHIERYVSNGECAECRRAWSRAWRSAHPEEERARRRTPEKERARHVAWRVAHPDHYAAWNGLNKARQRFPGCVPAHFDFEATVPFYRDARRLTRETGIPHEVDHIVALCLGGKHVASNLQVLTKEANRKKATAERAAAEPRR